MTEETTINIFQTAYAQLGMTWLLFTVLILAIYFGYKTYHRTLDEHRQERDEWRKSFEVMQTETVKAVTELTTFIRAKL